MIKPAALITWPCHVDFPLFRHNLNRYRHFFKDIFIAFTNEAQPINYRAWIMNNLPFVQFTKPLHQKTDWRDDTVNSLLTLDTTADYYIFLEQDFLVDNETFWDKILTSDEPFIYYEEGGRIHPAFSIVKRDLVNKTSLNFAANPPGYDHFGKFFQEIKAMTPGKDIRDFGLKERENFYHIAGLTQNYYCVDNDQPLYKPDEFLAYNILSIVLPYQNPNFYNREFKIAEKYGYSDNETFLSKFFPKVK